MKITDKDFQIRSYESIDEKQIEWLWYPYIPFGKITIIQGDPGEGKSTLALQIAALLTQGQPMPDGSCQHDKMSVIYQAAEDSPSDTIKPRLLAAEADCKKIWYIDIADDYFSLEDDLLEIAIQRSGARLLVIDPLQAFLSFDGELQNLSRMRQIMRKLNDLADRTGCAVVLIGHLNKNAGSKGIYRGLGSIDIAAAARSILMVVRDKSDPVSRYMIQIKNNLAAEGSPFAFSLSETEGFSWIGKVDHDYVELLSGHRQTESKVEKAKTFLELLLGGADLPGSLVYEKLRAYDIGSRTVEKAKAELKVISYKKDNTWYWKMPS